MRGYRVPETTGAALFTIYIFILPLEIIFIISKKGCRFVANRIIFLEKCISVVYCLWVMC